MIRKLSAYVFCGLLIVCIGTVVIVQQAARVLPERLVKDLGMNPPDSRGDPEISPDGSRVAWIVRHDGKQAVFCEGKTGPPFERVGRLRFSPNSRSLAYMASENGKQFVVLNGVRGPEYERIPGKLIFSPDSKKLAYVVRDGKKCFVVSGGKEGPVWQSIIGPIFSPDSKHVAYTGRRNAIRVGRRLKGGEYVTVIDGKEVTASEDGFLPRYSADGKRLAYRLTRDGKSFVVVDGEELGPYGSLAKVELAPKGNDFTIEVTQRSNEIVIIDGRKTRKPNKEFVIRNGKQGSVYEWIGYGRFSPDGKRYAYWARRGDKTFTVLDGEESPSYDHEPRGVLFSRFLAFSPDSKRFAYAARRDGKSFIVCDGREGETFDLIGGHHNTPQLVFSPDGKHIVYTARIGREEGFLVCDGVRTPSHGNVFLTARYNETPGKLRYNTLELVKENGKARFQLALYEIDWPKDLDWTNGLKPAPEE